MKSIIAMSASAAFVLGLAIPALAGPVGMERAPIASSVQAQEDLALLANASGEARVAAQGSKNHQPFTYRAYDIDKLKSKIQNGEPVSQAQVDQALQPVVLN